MSTDQSLRVTDCSTRRLGTDDVADIKVLNRLFADVFEDHISYQDKPPTDEYLQDFLSKAEHIVLIAEKSGSVIGGLVAYCLNKFEQERKEIYLYDMAVSRDMQQMGIGSKLIIELRKIAKDLGAYVIFVQADEGDAAIKFYEALQPRENLKTRCFDFKV